MTEKIPSVLDIIDQGIWSYDLRHNILKVLNRPLISILKLRPEEIKSPDSWLQYVCPEDRVTVKKLLAPVKKTDEITCLYRYQPPGHQVQWISERRIIIYNKAGKAVRLEGILTDVSAQKAGEEAQARQLYEKNLELEAANEELSALNEELYAANEEMHAANEELQAANEKITEQADIIARQSEEKINRILHSLNDVVWSVDLANNEISYISPAVEKVYGISIEEVYSNPYFWGDAIHPEDKLLKESKITEAYAQGNAEYTYRIISPDNTIGWLYDRIKVVYDDDEIPVRIDGISTDITELVETQKALEQREVQQKQTETRLLDTTERFAMATQAAQIGIWEWKIQDNSLLWDELTCSIFEVRKEEFTGNLDTWVSFLHPDTLSYAQQQVEKALQGESNYNVELKIITATQKVKYVKSYAYVLFNEQKQPERMIGAMWDITWQKYAEEELIRYSERLDTVIGSITDGFFIVDHRWKFIRMNQAFERVNKVSEGKLIGKNLWEAFPGLKKSILYEEYHRALDTNQSRSFEIQNPSSAWYHVSVYPSKAGLAVYFRDITKEKETQQQILFSQKNLDALINNTPDVIWSIDKNMRIVSANHAYKDMLAILMGNRNIKKGDPAITRADDYGIARRFEKYYRRALGGERFSVEETAEVPGVGMVYVEVSFNPMYNEAEEVIGIGCFSRNITARKKAEEEKSHLIQRLLEQNKYLEEFAFITSHNLRAPVARILGLTSIFNRKNMADPLNLELVNNLEKSAHLLDEVIKDIAQVLDIRKQEDEMREEVNLNNIMAEVKELLAHEIEKTNTEITEDFSEGAQLYTIKSYLRNVLLNLVSNAIKYKKLEHPPQIAVQSYYKPGYLCFSVKDNGLGIDLEKYGNQVFTLYKRFHSHTEGKGMGMYLIKSQVDALGGIIHIESQVNEGTTVEVCLKNELSGKE